VGLAVTTLAFDIAVNATVSSLVKTILYSELPFRDPATFAFIWAAHAPSGEDRPPLSLPDFAEIQEGSRTLEGVSAFLEDSYILTGAGDPVRVTAFRASANFHDVWGVDVVAGRGFRPDEDRPGAEPVVILSHGFWVRRFGSDLSVLGTTLRLDGERYTVIGVLSPR